MTRRFKNFFTWNFGRLHQYIFLWYSSMVLTAAHLIVSDKCYNNSTNSTLATSWTPVTGWWRNYVFYPLGCQWKNWMHQSKNISSLGHWYTRLCHFRVTLKNLLTIHIYIALVSVHYNFLLKQHFRQYGRHSTGDSKCWTGKVLLQWGWYDSESHSSGGSSHCRNSV